VRFEREFESLAPVLPRGARRFDESITGEDNNGSENGMAGKVQHSTR